MTHYTPAQTRILDYLQDGKRHTREELRLAIDPDGLVDQTGLRNHLRELRRKLRVQGMDVLHEYVGFDRYYRMVRLISTDE